VYGLRIAAREVTTQFTVTLSAARIMPAAFRRFPGSALRSGRWGR